MKIIIELRDYDSFKTKVDNINVIEEITNYVKEYWNCESIEVLK